MSAFMAICGTQARETDAKRIPARELYTALMDPASVDRNRDKARRFLQQQLQAAKANTSDIPSPDRLLAWVRKKSEATAKSYSDYLHRRQHGGAREYFSNRSHALYFLKHVAPTKLVDGAWLYGLLSRWQNMHIRPLVQTYLEELGEGVAPRNHVLLYKKLLIDNGSDVLEDIEDSYFATGTCQLALGHLSEEFFPEVLGYNLGYEQLPLHLLITTYELSELGIDPYYFQLHVTIDNASRGHAQKAADAIINNLPIVGDRQQFMNRVALGHGLAELGPGSVEIIEGFDLDREVIGILERKRLLARNIHSDHSRIGCRTVNQWLDEPGRIPEFLRQMQSQGWIRRHQHPQQSRFWQLIDGDRAAMFGVFDHYERQLIFDWIAGSRDGAEAAFREPTPLEPRLPIDTAPDDEASVIDQALMRISGPTRISRMIELMSPATHFTSAGLVATRLFHSHLHGSSL